ncbi:MAG: hypothetical protein FWC26_13740 [Fibromonadales bacterium]|nr:hypothetical protein [Fibromonadales bacterium]
MYKCKHFVWARMEKRIEDIFRSSGGTINMSYAIRNGISRLASIPSISEPNMAITSLRFSKSVISLISALFYHKITMQIPHFVYVAIPRRTRPIKLDYPPGLCGQSPDYGYRFTWKDQKQ